MQFQVNTEKHLPAIVGNKNRIRQVPENLLTNARQHMGERPNPPIAITLSSNEDSVITQVSDHGIGVIQDYQEKILDRFFRVPSQEKTIGSGLGLSIVKHIIESHRGRVWVEPDTESGVTISFSLPSQTTSNS